MNLNQLRMFVKAVDSKGFSAAAQQLNISSTAVSKQIKILEDILNVQLIKRTTTKFRVTEIGELFYAYCVPILNDIDNLKDIAQSFSKVPSGKLKVFTSTAFGENFILPYLKEFILNYPKVSLELDLSDRIPDVRAEGIDLCFGLIGHWDQALIQKKLLETAPCLLAAPSYLQQYGEPRIRDELLDHHFICHSNRPDSLWIMFEKGSPLLIKASMFVNNDNALLQCAMDGLGIVYLYDYIARALVEEGELKPILSHEPITAAHYYAFYSPTHHIKPASRALLDYIFTKLKEFNVESGNR